MREIALVIMAAGIGSRYGKGIKQLQKVGPQGELIMDYSVHDAIEAGFQRVIFIIRKDIEKEFRQAIGDRLAQQCKVDYVYQDLQDLPEGYSCPSERTKPWGTGQAILACREILHTPFAIINADDYYGKEAFRRVYRFLEEHYDTQYQYCMAGFELSNTLSENGTVTRGICTMDEKQSLQKVVETHEIQRREDGRIVSAENDGLSENTLVSMNMWGVTPEYIDILKDRFISFLSKLTAGDTKAEYLLPTVMDQLLREHHISVQVLSTPDRWFGVTYAEDRDSVTEAFQKLVAEGVYSENLWS